MDAREVLKTYPEHLQHLLKVAQCDRCGKFGFEAVRYQDNYKKGKPTVRQLKYGVTHPTTGAIGKPGIEVFHNRKLLNPVEAVELARTLNQSAISSLGQRQILSIVEDAAPGLPLEAYPFYIPTAKDTSNIEEVPVV